MCRFDKLFRMTLNAKEGIIYFFLHQTWYTKSIHFLQHPEIKSLFDREIELFPAYDLLA